MRSRPSIVPCGRKECLRLRRGSARYSGDPASRIAVQQGAAGQLKTDTSKTKDDVKTLDVNKAEQDAARAKEDAQDLEDDAKAVMKNPFGK